MKLFYWQKLFTLFDNSPGLALAHANTKKEAINEIVRKVPPTILDPGLKLKVRTELETTEPFVTEDVMGIALWGMDWDVSNAEKVAMRQARQLFFKENDLDAGIG